MAEYKTEQCKKCAMNCPPNIVQAKLNKGRIPFDKCMDFTQKQTNADRIRSMSDEELAELFYQFESLSDELKYCKNKTECEDLLDEGKTIPDNMCKKCLVEWLQSEVEE